MLNANQQVQDATQEPQQIPVPNHFNCPLSKCIMRDPVMSPSGYTYERKWILKAIQKNGEDPLTRQKITANDLKVNRALKDGIESFLEGYTDFSFETASAPTVYPNVTKKLFSQLDSNIDLDKSNVIALVKDSSGDHVSLIFEGRGEGNNMDDKHPDYQDYYFYKFDFLPETLTSGSKAPLWVVNAKLDVCGYNNNFNFFLDAVNMNAEQKRFYCKEENIANKSKNSGFLTRELPPNFLFHYLRSKIMTTNGGFKIVEVPKYAYASNINYMSNLLEQIKNDFIRCHNKAMKYYFKGLPGADDWYLAEEVTHADAEKKLNAALKKADALDNENEKDFHNCFTWALQKIINLKIVTLDFKYSGIKACFFNILHPSNIEKPQSDQRSVETYKKALIEEIDSTHKLLAEPSNLPEDERKKYEARAEINRNRLKVIEGIEADKYDLPQSKCLIL